MTARLGALADPKQHTRHGPFFLPNAPDDVRHILPYFKSGSFPAYFTPRFLSEFLTKINKKNKRSNDGKVDPETAKSIDTIMPTGLCNQMIEFFVLEYADRFPVRTDSGRLFSVRAQYNTMLGRHQTRCFAPFRRGTPIYYVDTVVAQELCDTYTDPEAKTALVAAAKVVGVELANNPVAEESGSAGALKRRIAALEKDMVQSTTIGQLNFFRWFIRSGVGRMLLENRERVYDKLKEKRKEAIRMKEVRKKSGDSRKRGRKVTLSATRVRTVNLAGKRAIFKRKMPASLG